jgi:hypothetical protein
MVASSLSFSFPDARPQRFAGEHHAGEMGAVGMHPAGLAVQDRVDDRLAGNAIYVESVQDWPRKTGGGSEFGIGRSGLRSPPNR